MSSSRKFTKDEVSRNLEVAEANLVKAHIKMGRGRRRYRIVADHIGDAFAQLVAQTRALHGNVNITYRSACGSKLHVVCIATARVNAQKALNPPPPKRRKRVAR